jgi:hypothetical protein
VEEEGHSSVVVAAATLDYVSSTAPSQGRWYPLYVRVDDRIQEWHHVLEACSAPRLYAIPSVFLDLMSGGCRTVDIPQTHRPAQNRSPRLEGMLAVF